MSVCCSLSRRCSHTVATFTYDDAGRQITDNGRRMRYDGLDQLVSVELADGLRVEYAYGHDGQRIRTTDNRGSAPEHWFTPDLREQSGALEQYVRVGDRIVAKVDLAYLDEKPAAATIDTGRTVSVALLGTLALILFGAGLVASAGRRTWRPALAAMLVVPMVTAGCGSLFGASDAPLWRVTETTYFHSGFGAGPVLITGDGGRVVDERRYEPFGQPIESWREPSGLLDAIDFALEPFNILNKPTDPRTGWSYHGARWLAPETARWLSPDPPVKGPDPTFMEVPWKLHPYQYVQQNPILYWDPLGLDGIGIFVANDQHGDSTQATHIQDAYQSVDLVNGIWVITYVGQDGLLRVHLVHPSQVGPGETGYRQIEGNVIVPTRWNERSARTMYCGDRCNEQGFILGMEDIPAVYDRQAEGAIRAMQGFEAVINLALLRGQASRMFRPGAPKAAGKAGAAAGGAKKVFEYLCFVAGTPVLTPDGHTPIDELEVGDLVLTRDDVTGEMSRHPVTAVYVTPDQPILEVTLVDDAGQHETLGVTGEHPFWVEAHGWLRARNLTPGHRVAQVTGGWLRVASVEETGRRETVYNVEVAGTHTYFAGVLGAWVHNNCWDDIAAHVRQRFPGKTQAQVARYLQSFAEGSTPILTQTGNRIWRRGAEILIQNPAGTTAHGGTYIVKHSTKAAIQYVEKFIIDNYGVVF